MKLKAENLMKLDVGMHHDGRGLYLQCTAPKNRGELNRSWIYRYKIGKKVHDYGLGSLHDVSLAEARRMRKQCAVDRHNGIDLVARRRERKAAAARKLAEVIKTLDTCWAEYIDAHRAEWRSTKHLQDWQSTGRDHVSPKIGRMAIADVDTPHVLSVLRPIWAMTTASRIRDRIELVIDYAVAAGYRERGLNPARWRGHLDKLLAKPSKARKKKNHNALVYTDTPSFVADLRLLSGTVVLAFEFMVLCASRTGEVLGALWSEVDLKARIWTIAASRMKGGREHRVPLSDRAIEILKAQLKERRNAFVFPGNSADGRLGDTAFQDLLRRMKRDKATTVHGFRSCFRSWGGDRTNFPREMLEYSLAHRVGDETERAYQRSDAIEKRRRVLQAWAGYLARPADENVRTLRAVVQIPLATG